MHRRCHRPGGWCHRRSSHWYRRFSSLASLPRVTVLSRASVTEARGRVKDQAALTKDLGATYMVEGSVQESAGILRVSLNLVRPDRSVAWGDSVEGKFEQIFELQS